MSSMTMLYVHGENIGYARAGSMIADELRRRGVTVYDDDGYRDNTLSGELLRGSNDGHEHIPPSGAPPNLLNLVSVPTHFRGWWDGQYRSILTMWEAMQLPEAFRETLDQLDMILVPSFQNVDLFSEFHPNVQYIPLGVETSRWHYREPPLPYPIFKFLISGKGDPDKLNDRKGVDVAYRAFRAVFPKAMPLKKGMPIPTLIMKSIRGQQGDYYGPGIQHVTGKLTPDEESDLYESCHCYLQPSKGEGWGLQPLQAIAMGRPTILTAAHGHVAFSHLGIGLDWKPTKAGYFIYGDAGDWWEPDFEQLCEAMYDVYMNYEDHCQTAKVSSEIATETFTWEHTTDRFQELLGEQMGLPYQGNHEWCISQRQQYRITVNRIWEGEIGGVNVRFLPGKEYYALADVKRILFDAGILAADCLYGTDHGLATVQLAQRDDYKAHEEFCGHCGQMLNSGIKKSDLLYEEMLWKNQQQ